MVALQTQQHQSFCEYSHRMSGAVVSAGLICYKISKKITKIPLTKQLWNVKLYLDVSTRMY